MIWFDGFAIQEVMEEKLALSAGECQRSAGNRKSAPAFE
jgi:hypothetical protein